MFERQSGRCFYTGVKLNFGPEPHNPLYPSIDRVDSKIGYTLSNTALCAWWVNRAKSLYSVEMFESLLQSVREVSSEELVEARK